MSASVGVPPVQLQQVGPPNHPRGALFRFMRLPTPLTGFATLPYFRAETSILGERHRARRPAGTRRKAGSWQRLL